MLRALQIQNFRGLRKVDLPELRRVNLIVGANDTGKTSVLEALTLLLGDERMVSSLASAFRKAAAPGNPSDERIHFWDWLFYDRDERNQVKLLAELDFPPQIQLTQTAEANSGTGHPVTAFHVRSKPGTPTKIIRYDDNRVSVWTATREPSEPRVARHEIGAGSTVEDAERFNEIALSMGGEERLEVLMRKVEPRVRRIRFAKLAKAQHPLVYIDLGLSTSVPITQMGQAFNRLFRIYVDVIASKAQVLLIDEIENGIFSDLMPKIWAGLMELCAREGVQIFATTHSRECVMAAQAASQARGQDDLALFRLQRVKGEIEAIRLGGEHLELAAEMGLEVRS
jgi:AAA domain, putative AbiEii toxin, Type IV TA system/AAA ATPase domain